jgi:CubicO group peptidase (beta-lactamase class C family)
VAGGEAVSCLVGGRWDLSTQHNTVLDCIDTLIHTLALKERGVDRRAFIATGAAGALMGCIPLRTMPQLAAVSASSLPIADELDTLLTAMFSRFGTMAGLAVAIVSPEGGYSRGFGYADLAARVSADAATAFYVASATKPLTALALATQAGRDGFGLDVPIADFAPDAPLPSAMREARLSFRQLLTHSAAVRHDALGYRLAFSGDHNPELLWQLLAQTRFSPQGLGQFAYTNIGFNIATLLTDHEWRESWQDLLDRVLFAPAGMRGAAARRSVLERRGVAIARPHAAMPEGVVRLDLEKDDSTMQSAGGVMMSATDALRWLELLTNDGRVAGRQIVPERLIAAAFAPAVTTDSDYEGYPRSGYGLGWYSGSFDGAPLVHHFGGFAGARAHMSVLPGRRTGVVVIQNESSPLPMIGSLLARFAYRRLAQQGDARSRLDQEMEAFVSTRDRWYAGVTQDRQRRAARRWQLSHPAAAYAGTYSNAEMGDMIVMSTTTGLHFRLGRLTAQAEPFDQPDTVRVELVPQSGGLITFQGNPVERLTFSDFTFVRR